VIPIDAQWIGELGDESSECSRPLSLLDAGVVQRRL
jgi:hypothetical protein